MIDGREFKPMRRVNHSVAIARAHFPSVRCLGCRAILTYSLVPFSPNRSHADDSLADPGGVESWELRFPLDLTQISVLIPHNPLS